MFDPASFVRVIIFGIIYAGIEYRYVNRSEADWTKTAEGFSERPLFWAITPYHFFLLLPLFVVASYAPSITAWAGNVFFLAVIEDAVYFIWRRRPVAKADWTTTLMGSIRFGPMEVPVWWPLDTLIAAVLFWLWF
ncbi:MAG TPA: hypothetical protein VJR06_06710 [Nitrososphaerales archaeon]|nr:hypothetical protein [Nitrososphaerales archaeon]